MAPVLGLLSPMQRTQAEFLTSAFVLALTVVSTGGVKQQLEDPPLTLHANCLVLQFHRGNHTMPQNLPPGPAQPDKAHPCSNTRRWVLQPSPAWHAPPSPAFVGTRGQWVKLLSPAPVSHVGGCLDLTQRCPVIPPLNYFVSALSPTFRCSGLLRRSPQMSFSPPLNYSRLPQLWFYFVQFSYPRSPVAGKQKMANSRNR